MTSKYIFIQSKNYCIQEKIFLSNIFFSFIFLLYEFFIEYFSGEHIWSSTRIYESQNFTFSMQTEQQHEDVNILGYNI